MVRMSRKAVAACVRWVIASLVAIGLFWLCLWLFHFAWFSWLPRGDADRWVVAAAFATVTATVVGAAMAYWAGRGDRADTPETRMGWTVRQKARASRNSRITQVGRDLRDPWR